MLLVMRYLGTQPILLVTEVNTCLPLPLVDFLLLVTMSSQKSVSPGWSVSADARVELGTSYY